MFTFQVPRLWVLPLVSSLQCEASLNSLSTKPLSLINHLFCEKQFPLFSQPLLQLGWRPTLLTQFFFAPSELAPHHFLCSCSVGSPSALYCFSSVSRKDPTLVRFSPEYFSPSVCKIPVSCALPLFGCIFTTPIRGLQCDPSGLGKSVAICLVFKNQSFLPLRPLQFSFLVLVLYRSSAALAF